ncbi:phage tail protein [Paenirhodobacter populi]|uniref:Uncharacterized protein n=1 Tax=Paenirhodobacter populi TaxID=2306993 RepID=A0A443J029_9RHOB|nr:phage tail protein [Sinirhodobacter populi]RWR13821.1 hypothetical protein D2T33_05330 [Sinirhodobacter populi]
MAVKGKIPVYDYMMTEHAGICLGPADGLFGIYVEDKLAWPPAQTNGDDSVAKCPDGIDYLGLNLGLPVEECIDPDHGEVLTTERTIFIDETELFGGDHRNGGVSGVVHWLPGRITQVLPGWIAERLGFSDPAQAPGYRGISSLWFTGGQKPEPERNSFGLIIKAAVTGAKIIAKKMSGFRWGTNMKYDMVSTAARVFVRPSVPSFSEWLASVHDQPGFPAEEASVIVVKTPLSAPRKKPNSGGEMFEQGGGFPTINAAAQIHALIASGAYDVNAGQTSMDHESFITCARILSREGLGVSFIVTGEETTKALVGEILNHVGGAVFVSPKTGLWTMRLFRPDTAFDELWGEVARPELTGFVLSPSNAELDGDFERQTWADIVNTVDVSYTEDETQERKILTLVNSSAIAAAGGEVVRDDLDYGFFRCEEAAKVAGQRALGVSSRPLMSASWVVNQSGSGLECLDVITVNWPSEGIVGGRWRVLTVEYGDSEDGSVRIEAIEDVFSEEPLQVSQGTQPGLWTPDSTRPEISNTYVFELGNQVARVDGYPDEDLEKLEDDKQVITGHLLSSNDPMMGVNLFTQPQGGVFPDNGTFVASTPCAVLGVALGIQDESQLSFYDMNFGPQESDIDVGDLMVIVRPSSVDGKHFERRTNTSWAAPHPSGLHYDYPDLSWEQGGEYFSNTYTVTDGVAAARRGLGHAVLALDDTLPPSQHAWKIGQAFPEEIVMVTALDRETGKITVRRGCYDTHPAPAPANSIVFHVKSTPSVSAGELWHASYLDAYQPVSVSGVSTDYHFADSLNTTASRRRSGRAFMPPRNANVTIVTDSGEVGFGGRIEIDEPQDITVRWSTRNRDLEDLQPMKYSGIRVTPEEGQRTIVRVYRRVRRGEPLLVPVISFYDLPGDSYVLPHWVFNDSMIDPQWNKALVMSEDGQATYKIEPNVIPSDIAGAAFVITVASQRYGDVTQGVSSGLWMSLEESITLVDIGTTPGGWGMNYGMDYGGTP